METTSALDSGFLQLEDRHAALQIGSVGVFEGPVPAFETIRDEIAGKLHRLPRYRQRMLRVPGNVGRPMWQDDPDFDLAYHLRRAGLQDPGEPIHPRRADRRLASVPVGQGTPGRGAGDPVLLRHQVNDVVLAAVTLAYCELLISRGGAPTRRTVRTLVPVSVRRGDERGHLDNRVSAIVVDLPVDVSDPVDVLTTVAARMPTLKSSHEAEAGELVTAVGNAVPPPGLAASLRLAFRVPQHFLTTDTASAQGPPEELRPEPAAGRPKPGSGGVFRRVTGSSHV